MKSRIETPSPLGAVFTPLDHSQYMIQKEGLYQKWQEGATFLDPTAGSGNILEAFIKTAVENGDTISDQLLRNLYAVEMQEHFAHEFLKSIQEKYKITFPEQNYIVSDFLFNPPVIKTDFLVGNPPWLNFCDIEEPYKEKVKEAFVKANLTGNKKDLLLGNSRVEMAALVILNAIRNNLKDKGKAYFYLPLSLFLNDGANRHFRSVLSNGDFSLDRVDDYKDFPLFPNVATRYGFSVFSKNAKTIYPLTYNMVDKEGKLAASLKATPLRGADSPLIIHEHSEELTIPQIEIPIQSKPRQGLNTCGANHLFIFDSCEVREDNLCLLKNKKNEALLPSTLIYPLIGANQFKENKTRRYVFLPYDKKGKILTEKKLKEKYSNAWNYLNEHRVQLQRRKGVLIGSSIKKGLWWSLLGIGPYSFSPWKIVWEAYGKKTFNPRLFSKEGGKVWQPNQALQAFLPFENKESAQKVLKRLSDPHIEKILRQQGMEGTCNWAQPGRMMSFFRFNTED